MSDEKIVQAVASAIQADAMANASVDWFRLAFVAVERARPLIEAPLRREIAQLQVALGGDA